MDWTSGVHAPRAAMRRVTWPRVFCAAACALVLTGCTVADRPDMSATQPRGATVAFESIDGPPPGQFRQLVQDLNTEAQSHRLAVLSRESPSAYRVRGYIAAKVAKNQATISWVWDVFDRDQRRAFRITGEETAKGQYRDAWAAADEAMLNRIAQSSITQLASFLTSPEVTPSAALPSGDDQLELAGAQGSTPEAAGIFRIFQAHADPKPAVDALPAATPEPLAGPIPLPRRRPQPADAVSARDTLTFAAAH